MSIRRWCATHPPELPAPGWAACSRPGRLGSGSASGTGPAARAGERGAAAGAGAGWEVRCSGQSQEGAWRDARDGGVGGRAAWIAVSEAEPRSTGVVSSLSPSHRPRLPGPDPRAGRRSAPGRTGAGTTVSRGESVGRANGELKSSAAPRRARPVASLRVSSTPSGWASSTEKALRGRCLPESVMFTSTRTTNRPSSGISLVQVTHDFDDSPDQGRRLVWRNAAPGTGQ